MINMELLKFLVSYWSVIDDIDPLECNVASLTNYFPKFRRYMSSSVAMVHVSRSLLPKVPSKSWKSHLFSDSASFAKRPETLKWSFLVPGVNHGPRSFPKVKWEDLLLNSTANNKSVQYVIFCVLTGYSFVAWHRRFAETCCLYFQG